MPTFIPPTRNGVPPVLPEGDPEQSEIAFRLYRFYSARPEGINVYQYRAGSPIANVVGEISETDPYPIYDSDGVMTSDGWEDLVMVWWGDYSPRTVTDAQATLLTNAGYTVIP